jgi:hypothetical protein
VVSILTPRNASDLAIALCLLDAYGFPYFVHNYYFGGLYPVPVFDLYNLRRVFVPSEFASEARQLIDDFLPGIEYKPYDMSPADKGRVLVEFFLLGGWFVPGNKWPRDAVV